MNNDATRSTPAREVRREFNRAATALCGLGGVAGLVLGGYAVVETDNELGTVAAMTFGFLFAVMALLGRVPRIKVGDTEIDPSVIAAIAAHESADAVADKVAEVAATTDDAGELVKAARSASDHVSQWYFSNSA